MTRIFLIGLLSAIVAAVAACDQAAPNDQRCNPQQFSNQCNSGYSCVYPTAPNCGVAYCCKVDDSGNVTDDNPNCQPDPTLGPVCGLDLGGTD
jgi:hypothetical protein